MLIDEEPDIAILLEICRDQEIEAPRSGVPNASDTDVYHGDTIVTPWPTLPRGGEGEHRSKIEIPKGVAAGGKKNERNTQTVDLANSCQHACATCNYRQLASLSY